MISSMFAHVWLAKSAVDVTINRVMWLSQPRGVPGIGCSRWLMLAEVARTEGRGRRWCCGHLSSSYTGGGVHQPALLYVTSRAGF